MTMESGQSTEAGTPENSAVLETPPPTVRLQISAAKKLNLSEQESLIAMARELGLQRLREASRGRLENVLLMVGELK